MKNRGHHIKKTGWLGISPWFVIAATFILVPIFVFLILDNIHKQSEHMLELFQEKGDTLIRSLEAGVRTGMREGDWDFFQLQKLLIETAQQPDIDFITVTDERGLILADSDPSLIGEFYGSGLDLADISLSRKIQWRLVPNPDGIDTFEVYRRFSPSDRSMDFYEGLPPSPSLSPGKKREGGAARKVIFIGFNVGPIETARKDAARHSVLMAVVLVFIGISGIISLFLAQGYRLARSSLSRIKAFSDNIVENMPIGLLALDGKGKIMAFNQKAEAIIPSLSGEAVGGNADAILPQPLKELRDDLEGKKGIAEREMAFSEAGGRTVPLEVIATPLEEEGDVLLGYIFLLRDMTELQHLKREVARSQRLASLGSLAAGVAHEIRNPLSSIKGFATFFRELHGNSKEERETADIMIREVERVNRVVGQLLELARPMAMEWKRASLATTIRHALKMVEEEAGKKKINIKTEFDPSVPGIIIDEDKIKQVLLNLFLNALAAMEDGGVLTVRLSVLDGDRMDITVSDTGKGIRAEDLPRIFDPYFTTKPSGTGLGLSIVHKIIEAHDGETRVDSTPGEGTAVSVILPAR